MDSRLEKEFRTYLVVVGHLRFDRMAQFPVGQKGKIKMNTNGVQKLSFGHSVDLLFRSHGGRAHSLRRTLGPFVANVQTDFFNLEDKAALCSK